MEIFLQKEKQFFLNLILKFWEFLISNEYFCMNIKIFVVKSKKKKKLKLWWELQKFAKISKMMKIFFFCFTMKFLLQFIKFKLKIAKFFKSKKELNVVSLIFEKNFSIN